MANRIPSPGDSPPRRILVQAALPKVSITLATGRGDPNASENVGATTVTETATTKGPLIVDSSRRVSTLPRSASMGNICSLRSDACSRASDRHRSSHITVQSVAIEDPFIVAPDRVPPTYSSSSVTPTQKDRIKAIQAIITPEQDLSPRQDRLGQEITPANAQGVHIPAACVFMANLSSQRTIDQLEFSVAKAMEIFGKCYIKVQFDKNKMPYAFVQFEEEEEARMCIMNARGMIIDARPIRVEHARAHRSVYLTKVTGGPVGNDEAREVLHRFGAIEETCPTTVADQEMHGLPEGCWVKFRYFMDCKDAIAGLRHNQYYRLIVQVMNEAGGRTPSLSPSLNRGLNRGSRHGSDAKAIFVGSLPETVTEGRLRTLFSKYGGILDCKVIRKSLGGNQMNIFAFIEFRTVNEAAAAQTAPLFMDGVPLRIEAKRYTMRQAAAHNHQNRSPITFANANYQSPYQSPVYHANGTLIQYNSNSYPPVFNHGTPVAFATNHSPQVLPIRGGPPPHYGNTSNMSPYTQYPSPHYTSPLAPSPLGPSGSDMYGSPMHYSSGGGRGNTTPYCGSYAVSGPSCNMTMGPMQPIAEHEGEMSGPGGF